MRPVVPKGPLWNLANGIVLRYIEVARPNLTQEQRYRTLMRVRTFLNPELAIGQQEDRAPIKVGRLQYDYLVSHGLKPHHDFLDYGCGAVRGGRYVIPYLEEGRYYGVDISPDILRYSRRLLKTKGLDRKRPTLKHIQSSSVPFDRTFDFGIAQSVFSHTDRATTQHILCTIAKVLRPNGKFFGTFWIRDEYGERMGIDYYYPVAEIAEMAEKAGLDFEVRDDYVHPSQQMVIFRPR